VLPPCPNAYHPNSKNGRTIHIVFRYIGSGLTSLAASVKERFQTCVLLVNCSLDIFSY
jgi:hypothetical protein